MWRNSARIVGEKEGDGWWEDKSVLAGWTLRHVGGVWYGFFGHVEKRTGERGNTAMINHLDDCSQRMSKCERIDVNQRQCSMRLENYERNEVD